MTLEEAIVAISTSTSLSEADVAGVLACSDDERAALIAAYKGAGRMPSASCWDVALEILKGCAETAAMVIPIAGAISGVYGLGKL